MNGQPTPVLLIFTLLFNGFQFLTSLGFSLTYATNVCQTLDSPNCPSLVLAIVLLLFLLFFVVFLLLFIIFC